MTIKAATELVGEAKQSIETINIEQLIQELNAGKITLIDVRDKDEVTAGKIPGSTNVPRGMLEFQADPSSPMYNKVFDANDRIVLHCASGGHSALAAKTLKDMGYTNVASVDGGYKAWCDAGGKVD